MSPSISNVRKDSRVLFCPGTFDSWTSKGWERARSGSANINSCTTTLQKIVKQESLPIITFVKQFWQVRKHFVIWSLWWAFVIPILQRYKHRRISSWTYINSILETVLFLNQISLMWVFLLITQLWGFFAALVVVIWVFSIFPVHCVLFFCIFPPAPQRIVPSSPHKLTALWT